MAAPAPLKNIAISSAFSPSAALDRFFGGFVGQGVTGGLEIGDNALRFVSYEGGRWKLQSLRLPPDIIRGEEILDRAQFVEALKAFHSQILGPGKSKSQRISAAVSLGSIHIFSQVFSLPLIEGENLEKAVALNAQMVAPTNPGEAYSGWQIVDRDNEAGRIEVLTAFIKKRFADEIHAILKESGFVANSLESRALSFTRLTRKFGAGIDPRQAYVLLLIDSGGLDFIIMRKGQLYFEYFQSWRELQGEERKISKEAFHAAIIRSLHQVVNFYRAHWTEPISAVLLSMAASSTKEEVQKTIKDNFPLDVRELAVTTSPPLNPEWFVALGSALRTFISRRDDTDVSLMGTSAQEEFRRHQVITLLNFWRIVAPAFSVLFLAGLLATDAYLIRSVRSAAAQPLSGIGAERRKEIDDLQKSAAGFNRAVALLQAAEGARISQVTLLKTLNTLAFQNGVSLSRFYFDRVDVPVLLNGIAKNEESLLAFKRVVESEEAFQSVNLPLSEIRTGSEGVVFAMSFTIAASNAR